MDYHRIDSFLDKFKQLLSSSDEIYKVISETVNQKTGSHITSKDVRISGTTIYISGSPMLKSQILIYKDSILKDIGKFLPNKRLSDIR